MSIGPKADRPKVELENEIELRKMEANPPSLGCEALIIAIILIVVAIFIVIGS
jgi:hypothetical protein